MEPSKLNFPGKEVKSIPKGKALILGIICAASGVVLYANDQTTPIWAFIVISALFFSIWFYKFQRDRSIVAQARLEREQAAPVSRTILND